MKMMSARNARETCRGDQCRSAPWQPLRWIARLDWGLLKIIVPAALVLLAAFGASS